MGAAQSTSSAHRAEASAAVDTGRAWAHSPADASEGSGHDLVEHLQAVASASAAFAPPGLKVWAEIAGLWHDLGKFRPGFQRYIRLNSDAHIEGRARLAGRDKTHSAAGALHALRSFQQHHGQGAELPARVLAYVIAGHHAGLANWHDGLSPRLLGGSKVDAEAEYTQALQVCTQQAAHLISSQESFDLRAALSSLPGIKTLREEPLALSLAIRMIFSALVDADFLDTEAYFDRNKPVHRAGFPPISEYGDKLDARLRQMAEDVAAQGRAADPVMLARTEVLSACRASALLPQGVFSLTVPTGGGKTLASLAFALAHAQAHGLRRVVVAIPYTSIVEQTTDVLRGIFGPANVVEHHSQAEADDSRESARSRLACENWDAPLVVTTNVQLLESMFAARTSRCRKLHRLAGSVIVLDEAQLLPPPYLQPILDALRALVRFYGVTLLLCTATQPVLTHRERFDRREELRGLPPATPIIEDTARLYAALQRVRFEWPADWQVPTTLPDLAQRVVEHACVLVVVNTRDDAAHLMGEIDAASPESEPCLHLSAALCGQHRADTIAHIRSRLESRRLLHDTRPLRVVSTQLVEAGVDIDFPVVFRALAGLDSIAQAAGRCNREGHLGAGGGRVSVFVRPIPAALAALRHGAQATITVLTERAPPTLIPEDFERYFPLYYDAFRSRDEQKIVELLSKDARDFAFDFATAAEKFRLVDDADQASLVVPYVPVGSEACPILPTLAALASGGADRWRLRALQRYTVSARLRNLQRWQVDGSAVEVLPGIYQLTDALRYDERLGLLKDDKALGAASLVA